MNKHAVMLVVSLLLGCGKDSPSAPAVAVNVDDPTSCAPCHAAIVAEWSSSMHAAAHDDPIFLAMRTMRAGREGAALPQQCVVCHTPRVAERGVTCAACHAQSTAGAHLAGPRDLAAGLTPAHATGAAAPEIKDGVMLCMRCHEQLLTPAGVSVCTTGVEWRAHAGKDGCTNCHMPLAPGPGTLAGTHAEHRSHRFLGAHVRWGQGQPALEPLGLALRFDGAAVVATLSNKSGHDFPTGFPARMALIELVGLDAGGAEVWRNFPAGNPTPEAMLNKVYLDAKGEPTIAPWSVSLARDTRLRPGEARELRADVPAAVRTVKARALLRLLPPKLADKLGLSDDPLATPRPLASASVTRP